MSDQSDKYILATDASAQQRRTSIARARKVHTWGTK